MEPSEDSFDFQVSRRNSSVGGLVLFGLGLAMCWVWYRFGIQDFGGHNDELGIWPWFHWVFVAFGIIPVGITLVGLFQLLIQPSGRCWIENQKLYWKTDWNGVIRRHSRCDVKLDDLAEIKLVQVRSNEDTEWYRVQFKMKEGRERPLSDLKLHLTDQQAESLREALSQLDPSIGFNVVS